MTTEIVSVSHSRADTFLRCRRQNYYGYIQNLAPKHDSDSLFYGKVSHEVLDAFYSRFVDMPFPYEDIVFAAALKDAQDKMAELERDGYIDPPGKVPMRELLFDWYFPNEPFIREDYEILASEKAFNLKVSDELSYTFVVDLIVRDRHNRFAVVDHKNVYDFITEDEAALMPQLPKYIGALRALGHDIDYGIYNQLRTRKIKEPRLDQRLKQLVSEPSDVRIQRTFLEQIDTSLEILRINELEPEEQDRESLRTASQMVCRMCSFRLLCKTELNGDDADHVRQAFYQERETRDGVPITDDDIED